MRIAPTTTNHRFLTSIVPPKFHERIRDLILPSIKVAGHQQEDVEPMLRRLTDALADLPDDKPTAAEDVEIDQSGRLFANGQEFGQLAIVQFADNSALSPEGASLFSASPDAKRSYETWT